MGVVFPSGCLAATASLEVHARRVGQCGGWVGVIGCCRYMSDFTSCLQWTGGVAIAGALRHVPSLTVLEYVVGEAASGLVVVCHGCGDG